MASNVHVENFRCCSNNINNNNNINAGNSNAGNSNADLAVFIVTHHVDEITHAVGGKMNRTDSCLFYLSIACTIRIVKKT